MVADDEHVARVQRGVHCAGGVGEQNAFHAEATHELNRHHDGPPAFALVEVPPSAEGDDTAAADFEDSRLAGMARHRARTVAWNVGVGDGAEMRLVQKRAPPARSKDDADLGLEVEP